MELLAGPGEVAPSAGASLAGKGGARSRVQCLPEQQIHAEEQGFHPYPCRLR